MDSFRTKLRLFDQLLNSENIKLVELKSLCFNGIPDESDHRALCWRILLNYLPSNKKLWDTTLNQKRNLYQQFIEEMIVAPGKDSNDMVNIDHPLNIDPDSEWQTYFKDNDVLLQIDKDVRRLCPDISFFQQATDFPCLDIVNSQEIKRLHKRVEHTILKSANVERKGLGVTKMTFLTRKAPEEYAPMPEGKEAHWEVVERILFLYAKLNPGQGYVQGMNEILGPIYYTFASHYDDSFREYAEADSFFCFTNLMAETRDYFIKSLDETDRGINSMMTQFMNTLKKIDVDVWLRLKQQELYPQYFCFRWITLLLSQEFPLPDVLRIWDSLFADENRFEFLIFICCAMVMLLKNQILENDFSTNMKLLQNFPSMDVQIILTEATNLCNSNKLNNLKTS